MTRIGAISFLLLCVATMAHSASADVLLRRASEVEDSLIRLGDLFRGLPAEKADTPIAHAPSPGKKTYFDARLLAQLSLKYGVGWRPISRLDRVEVRRASLTIDDDALRRTVSEELIRRHDLADGMELHLDQRAATLHLPADASPVLKVSRLDFDRRAGRFVATVAATNIGKPTQLTVSGRVYETVRVPVIRRNLDKNEVIGAGDIEWRRVRANRARRSAVRYGENILGMSVTKRRRAGAILQTGDVQPAVVVSKGSLVTIFLVHGNLQLTVQGKALEDGSAGEVIRVQNTQSRRTIEARVMGPDRVRVGLHRNIALRP